MHSQKAPSPIVVRVSGRVMEVKVEQPLKASSSMAVTPGRTRTCVTSFLLSSSGSRTFPLSLSSVPSYVAVVAASSWHVVTSCPSPPQLSQRTVMRSEWVRQFDVLILVVLQRTASCSLTSFLLSNCGCAGDAPVIRFPTLCYGARSLSLSAPPDPPSSTGFPTEPNGTQRNGPLEDRGGGRRQPPPLVVAGEATHEDRHRSRGLVLPKHKAVR